MTNVSPNWVLTEFVTKFITKFVTKFGDHQIFTKFGDKFVTKFVTKLHWTPTSTKAWSKTAWAQHHGAIKLNSTWLFKFPNTFPVKWVKTSTHKCKSCKTKLVEHVPGTQNASSPVKARTWESEARGLFCHFAPDFLVTTLLTLLKRGASQMDFKAPT